MIATHCCRTFGALWQGVVERRSASYLAPMTINLWIPTDIVLAAIAPLGLAANRDTALVVDADPDGPNYPGSGSLAALVANGPRRADLSPARAGIAVLRNGGVSLSDAAEVLAALEAGWPNLVIRHSGPAAPSGESIAVIPDLPGALARRVTGPTVVQKTTLGRTTVIGDVQLPRPSARLIRTLLEGRLPGPSRWVRAWKPVWAMT